MRQKYRIATNLVAAAPLAMLVSLSIAAQSSSVIGPTPQQGDKSAAAAAAPRSTMRLTMREAIALGIRYNITSIESGENARLVRGQRLVALSKLLPQLSVEASENVDQLNLSTLGLRVPGIPTIVGPFSYTNVQGNLSQPVLNLESIQRFRAARTAEQAASLSYQDALDSVTLTVGSEYLQVLEDASRIQTQEAQVENANALYQQAADEVNAGTAPKIDATRTEVQLRTEEYNLLVARNNFAVAKLTLAKAIGLPLGQQFDLADTMSQSNANPGSLDDALALAWESRSDYLSDLESEQSAAQILAAAKAERYPTVSTSGDYADQGRTLGHSHGVFGFEATVSMPLFTGGRIKGDILQADATLKTRQADANNLHAQIEYDVRTAYLNLEAATKQVVVTKQSVELANESLSRSKDRFNSGVTDSVEVVQAEQALASANDQYITSLYNQNLARLTLARAVGVARTNPNFSSGGQ